MKPPITMEHDPVRNFWLRCLIDLAKAVTLTAAVGILVGYSWGSASN